MADPGFYNDNRNRTYPFVTATIGVPTVTPGTTNALPDDLIVDCGIVMGLESGFIAGTHKVWIDSILYAPGGHGGDPIASVVLASDAPGLIDSFLTFSCNLAGAIYQTDLIELSVLPAGVTIEPTPESLYSETVECSIAPLWSGFMVFGDPERFTELFTSYPNITGDSDFANLEPALIQSMVQGYVNSVNAANQDRTRATVPLDCSDSIDWGFPTGADQLFISAKCLSGDVQLMAGYNTIVRQDTFDNAIVFAAAKGAGEGEPCEEVELFYTELPPAGSTLLDGSVKCNEIVRTINGTGGQVSFLTSGTGVQVTTDPELHKILVDINMSQLFICYNSDYLRVSETV